MYGDSIDRILTANNIPEPTREGYEFTGWYLDSKYTMPYTPGMTMPNSALTLYAEWEATAYDVNYYDETVSAGSIWHDGYDDGDYVVHPTAIGGIPYVADGSWVEGKGEFLGWYWYVGGRLVSFSTDTPIEKSISL